MNHYILLTLLCGSLSSVLIPSVVPMSLGQQLYILADFIRNIFLQFYSFFKCINSNSFSIPLHLNPSNNKKQSILLLMRFEVHLNLGQLPNELIFKIMNIKNEHFVVLSK